MKKNERKQRLALSIYLSLVVFIIILLVVSISVAFVYFAVRLGIVDSVNQRVALSSVLFLLLIISIIIGFGLAVVASKISLRPIGRVINRINSLASGDFKVRLRFKKPMSYHPAFREFANSFNKMAAELEKTEMLRSDFVNNFSHEFKTPIVSIAGFAKLLKKGNLTPEQQAEYIDIIEEEALRLCEMATNVLNITKIENQTILTNVSQFNVSEQIRKSILMLEKKWSEKAVSPDIDFDEYTISANEEMLKHVWINLIDNAIKFSPPGESVSVKIADNLNTISVSITNYGVTISSKQQMRIFNKFYQADESHSVEGNGMGLAIVKKIVELHKGVVYVNSTDGVTTFTVQLPKTQDV